MFFLDYAFRFALCIFKEVQLLNEDVFTGEFKKKKKKKLNKLSQEES